MSDQNLSGKISQLASKMSVLKPMFFRLSSPDDAGKLEALMAAGGVQTVRDDFEEQHRELFGIMNPTLVYAPGFEEKFTAHYAALAQEVPLAERGVWVYFPWLFTLVHLLEDADFQRVRTARNRNLVTEEEQKLFYGATIGIGGLSVGNSVITSIVLGGGAHHIRLADHDTLALTNINRIRAGVQSLGLPKAEMTARQIYELNPYATIEIFSDGITDANIDAFFMGADGSEKLDIVIDELDTIAIKLRIREKAKQYRVPVLMGADNGDNIILDIERYDQDESVKPFQGRLGEVTYDELTHLDKFGIGRTITKMLGPENITERMQGSLTEMGKTIVSWPQLGGAALLNGLAVAYCARKVMTKESLESNRAIISLDEHLVPGYGSPEEVAKRANVTATFKTMFHLE